MRRPALSGDFIIISISIILATVLVKCVQDVWWVNTDLYSAYLKLGKQCTKYAILTILNKCYKLLVDRVDYYSSSLKFYLHPITIQRKDGLYGKGSARTD